MATEKAYLQVEGSVPQLLKPADINSAVELVESAIKLITDAPLVDVIESLTVKAMNGSGVEVKLAIFPRYRPLVFGKRFSNVVSLRKLISNLSGKSELEVWLSVVEK